LRRIVSRVAASRFRAKRPALPALLGVLLALTMTWPLVLHLGSETAQVESYDPLYLTWQVAWIGHALLHAPLHLLQSNLYWPLTHNLTFTDVVFGYAPAGLLAAHGSHAALVVHNLLFMFTYAFAFFGAYLLARELGAGAGGSIAAGAAFAYAPWKLEQNGHLHVLSSGGIPLALYLLVRGYRRRSGGALIAGWLVAAWQMTLGFTLGLQFAYLLLVLAAVVAVRWVQQGRPRPTRAVLGSSAAGIVVFATVVALMAQPFLRVHREHPEAKMPVAEVAFYSPPPRSFLAASSQSLLWASPTAHWRDSLRAPVEQTLFPGGAVLLLALLGLASRAYPSGLRSGLASGTVVCGVLSLGLPSATQPDRGFTPYRFLFDFAPGWDGVRTPGRINTLTSLGLALLAAAGVTLVLRHAQRLSARKLPALAVATVLVAAILAEGFGPMSRARVPVLPAGQLAAPAPQLHLPSFDSLDGLYGYWSTDGYPKLVNGAGSFDPNLLAEVRNATTAFPDAASVRLLRRLGVRSVIFHRDLGVGTEWQKTADRSIAGLGITREDEGELVIYRLRA
jgi:hypothetical protein